MYYNNVLHTSAQRKRTIKHVVYFGYTWRVNIAGQLNNSHEDPL